MDTDTGKAGSWFKTHWYWLLAIAAGIIIGILYIWPMISGFLGNLFSGLGASSPSSAAIPAATTGSGTASSGSGTVQTGTGTSSNSTAIAALTTELQKLQTELTLAANNQTALKTSLTQQISTLSNQIGVLQKNQTPPPTVKTVTRTKPTPVTQKVKKQLTNLQQQVTHTVTLGVENLRFTPSPSGPTYIGVHTGPKKPTMRVKTPAPKIYKKVISHPAPEPVSHSQAPVVRKPSIQRGVGNIMRIS